MAKESETKTSITTIYTQGQSHVLSPEGRTLEGQTSVCSLEDWMDGKTVMDMLDISIRTLQYYRTAHLFPYLKMGNKIYYKRADIEAYMEAEYRRQTAALSEREGGER